MDRLTTEGNEPTARAAADPFAVPRWLDVLGRAVSRRPNWWIRLGNLETRLLSDELDDQPVSRPIYISGLARSGSTILLELLARHPDTVSHRYRDFPLVHAPVFWDWFQRHAQRADAAPATQRAHGDGINVTADSPEAVEEVLWMSFFPQLHDPGVNQVLNATAQRRAFERFYQEHLRKLLWLHGGTRYLAKANYNVTRLEYLLQMFPDACFLVPVRDPVSHVASLMRQHRRFCARHRADPRSLRYMRRLGHFEFGLQRQPINAGDPEVTRRILDAWNAGREVEGWALLWDAVYRHVADLVATRAAVRRATLLLRHEDLCNDPEPMLAAVHAHCELDMDRSHLRQAACELRRPVARPQPLTPEDADTIRRITAHTAHRLGYIDGPQLQLVH